MENPNMVFLMETRIKLEKVPNVKFKYGYNCNQVVEFSGSGKERAGVLF